MIIDSMKKEDLILYQNLLNSKFSYKIKRMNNEGTKALYSSFLFIYKRYYIYEEGLVLRTIAFLKDPHNRCEGFQI
jgi:hypothetical protein